MFFGLLYCERQSFYLIKLTLQIFNNMTQQQQEQGSMEFSVIDQKQDRQIRCDFSAQSILQNSLQLHPSPNQQSKPPPNKIAIASKNSSNPVPIQKRKVIPGEFQQVSPGIYFLKDLERMQQQLSFQTQSYCVYEQQPYNSLQNGLSNNSKILSPVKTTKECTNKSISKVIYPDYNFYQGELICDFFKKSDHPQSKKIKQNLKNISRQLLSQNSNLSKSKTAKDSILSKDLKSLLSQQKSKNKTKPKVPTTNHKSKSRSVNKMGLNNSKSHKNIQISTQPEGFSLKILSDYYAGDMSLHCKKVQPNKKKQFVTALKQIEKSPKPKCLAAVFSPRYKATIPPSFKHIK